MSFLFLLPTPILPTFCKHQTHLLLPNTMNHINSGTLTSHANSTSFILTNPSKHNIKHEKHSSLFQYFFSFLSKHNFIPKIIIKNNSSFPQLMLNYTQFTLLVSVDDFSFSTRLLFRTQPWCFFLHSSARIHSIQHPSIYFFLFLLCCVLHLI